MDASSTCVQDLCCLQSSNRIKVGWLSIAELTSAEELGHNQCAYGAAAAAAAAANDQVQASRPEMQLLVQLVSLASSKQLSTIVTEATNHRCGGRLFW